MYAYLPALAGGLLIGLAAGGLRVFAGEIAGISGLLRGAIIGPGARLWRWAFLAGLLVAGVFAARIVPGQGNALADGRLGVIVVAGLLVGLRSGLSNGCTSGHGVCGLARLSPRSLVAVLTFMVTAAITVFLIRHGGAL